MKHNPMTVYPVRNSSGALAAQALAQRVKPGRNYSKYTPAAEQRAIISNGVKVFSLMILLLLQDSA